MPLLVDYRQELRQVQVFKSTSSRVGVKGRRTGIRAWIAGGLTATAQVIHYKREIKFSRVHGLTDRFSSGREGQEQATTSIEGGAAFSRAEWKTAAAEICIDRCRRKRMSA